MNRGAGAGTLYVVATPIGNLDDITLRALRVLGEVSVIAAEDTRVTARLAARHGIKAEMVSVREQNARKAVPVLLSRLESGDDVALVTDAGTPSVSDPGFELVAAAGRAGVRVTPIPGPSSLAAAISVSGLTGDGVRFLGFLPRSGRRRRDLLRSMGVDRALVVFYESPKRIGRTLAELSRVCGERGAVVARELTKLHEEIARGTLMELAERFGGEVRGEVTVVMEGNATDAEEGLSEERLSEIVRAELEAGGSARDVAASLASGLGLPRKVVYDIAISLISPGARGSVRKPS